MSGLCVTLQLYARTIQSTMWAHSNIIFSIHIHTNWETPRTKERTFKKRKKLRKTKSAQLHIHSTTPSLNYTFTQLHLHSTTPPLNFTSTQLHLHSSTPPLNYTSTRKIRASYFLYGTDEWCRKIRAFPSLLRLYPKVYSTVACSPVVAQVKT